MQWNIWLEIFLWSQKYFWRENMDWDFHKFFINRSWIFLAWRKKKRKSTRKAQKFFLNRSWVFLPWRKKKRKSTRNHRNRFTNWKRSDKNFFGEKLRKKIKKEKMKKKSLNFFSKWSILWYSGLPNVFGPLGFSSDRSSEI